MRSSNRLFQKLFVRELEDRTVPAMAVSLTGNAVTFLGDAANDSLTLGVTAGNLSHNLPVSGNLVSNIDLDGTLPGVQSLAITAVTGLTVTGSGGTDTLTVTDVATAATISVETFNWNASNAISPNADATLTDGAFTVNDVPAPYMYALNGVANVPFLTGASGGNTIDASAWNGSGLTINGLAGDDVLSGGAGNDNVNGGDGHDTVAGNGGNDTLRGDGSAANFSTGNDTLLGGAGADLLYGDDSSAGGTGADTLDGGSENDTLIGSGGDDTLAGSDGADSLSGGDGDDSLAGGQGNDTLNGDAGFDTLDGGIDNDTLTWNADGPSTGGAGTDTLNASGISTGTSTATDFTLNTFLVASVEVATLTGTAGNDSIDASNWVTTGLTINGLAGDDVLSGGAGNDNVNGGDGHDTVAGNGGNDTLRGDGSAANFSTGNDTLYGGAGADLLYGDDSSAGGTGADTLDGGSENDTLIGSGGNDTLAGGDGADSLSGGDGNDALQGDAGNDTLNGDAGFDTLDGGIDNDTLTWNADGPSTGGAGTDTLNASGISTGTSTATDFTLNTFLVASVEVATLTGTAGNDSIDASNWVTTGLTINGLAGDDVLSGGAGNDNVNGGDGHDTVSGHGGNDTLRGDGSAANFSTGNDTLYGGAGADLLYGDDSSAGGTGADTLDGGSENDTLIGSGGNDTLDGAGGNDSLFGGAGNDLLRDGPGTNTLNGEADFDTVSVYGTAASDVLLVETSSATINGSKSTFQNFEAVAHDTLGGVDDGTQVTAPVLPYTVAGLEPTFDAGPDAVSSLPLFTRAGTFKDIGDGQTWTGTVDYDDGGGFVPFTLDNMNRTYNLNHTYTTGGLFDVVVRIIDNQGNVGTDTFQLIRSTIVQLGTIGGNQRSMINKVEVRFDGVYTLNSGFFTFERLGGGTVPAVNASSVVSNGQTITTLTFSGPGLDPGGFSLADSRYRLTLNSSFITGVNGEFDGDGNGTPGGDLVYNFHRLFGDYDGNGTVDATDFSFFPAFGAAASSPFDFNINGDIDSGTDLAQFGNRFGVTL